jgi:hypothetical protein
MDEARRRRYTTDDHPRTALDMLIRAGEYAAACDMLNRSWLGHMRSGQHVTLRADLGRIALEVAESSAPYLVTRTAEGTNHTAWRSLMSH